MKRLLILTLALPLTALAAPLNVDNNPNQPGYEIPSQQRMQSRMLNQQQQQKGMLNQQRQVQTQQQQRHLQNQLNANQQRVQQAQPGRLTPQGQQPLPNNNGGMLKQY